MSQLGSDSNVIYIMVVQDRHTDLEFHTFIDPEIAMEKTREEINLLSRGPGSIEEFDVSDEKNVLFSAAYSEGGDYVFLVSSKLNMEIKDA